jgi:hypothetical protein
MLWGGRLRHQGITQWAQRLRRGERRDKLRPIARRRTADTNTTAERLGDKFLRLRYGAVVCG